MSIKKVYLYFVCLITLIMVIIAAVALLNTLISYVFQPGDVYARQLSWPLAMLIVSAPVYWLHWRMTMKEN